MDLTKKLLADLISFKSITPNGDEAICYCSRFLENLGFRCYILKFGDVSNLYAKLGNSSKNICFAGHIDVVPPMDNWDTNPFELIENGDALYGRGTNDMKGPLAACFAAISEYIEHHNNLDFSISIILTSDEEIMGENGTKKLIKHLKQNNEKITGCVLCESCSPKESGEYIKIGCRGSLNVDIKSVGPQCHVVSGKSFGNHLHNFVANISDFCKIKLDDGNSSFSPSDIELTSIDSGNEIRNIIPSEIVAKFNIRFNNLWDFDKLESFIKKSFPNLIISFERFGTPFIGSNLYFIDFLSKSLKKSLGKSPEIGTTGGNSDALSIRELTNVVEIGSPISNAHIINEFILKSDLIKLKKIYYNIILDFGN